MVEGDTREARRVSLPSAWACAGKYLLKRKVQILECTNRKEKLCSSKRIRGTNPPLLALRFETGGFSQWQLKNTNRRIDNNAHQEMLCCTQQTTVLP